MGVTKEQLETVKSIKFHHFFSGEVVQAIRALIETVEKLPETADGVRVVPGVDTVFDPEDGGEWAITLTDARVFVAGWTEDSASNTVVWNIERPVGECYSTRESALAKGNDDA